MTLDEAIEYYINVATQRAVADEGMDANDKWNETKFMTKKESEQIIADNRQLAEWLRELKQRREWCAQYEVEQISDLERYDMLSRECEILNERYKETVRLLKVAVDDMARTESCFLCKYYDRPDESCQTTDDCFVWRYADEALKLIGGNENG